MSVGVNVNFGALKNQSEFWKSPGKVLEICSRKWVRTLKDVHANCFCASLLRTQFHMPRHALNVRTKY